MKDKNNEKHTVQRAVVQKSVLIDGQEYKIPTDDAVKVPWAFCKNEEFRPHVSQMLEVILEMKKHFKEKINLWMFRVKAKDFINYECVVKEPICIFDIEKRIIEKEYKTYFEFERELRLVFENTMCYYQNHREINYYDLSYDMLKKVSKTMLKLKKVKLTKTVTNTWNQKAKSHDQGSKTTIEKDLIPDTECSNFKADLNHQLFFEKKKMILDAIENILKVGFDNKNRQVHNYLLFQQILVCLSAFISDILKDQDKKNSVYKTSNHNKKKEPLLPDDNKEKMISHFNALLDMGHKTKIDILLRIAKNDPNWEKITKQVSPDFFEDFNLDNSLPLKIDLKGLSNEFLSKVVEIIDENLLENGQ